MFPTCYIEWSSQISLGRKENILPLQISRVFTYTRATTISTSKRKSMQKHLEAGIFLHYYIPRLHSHEMSSKVRNDGKGVKPEIYQRSLPF